MKKCLNNIANHENLDLSCFFFLNWTNQTKKTFIDNFIFCFRTLKLLEIITA